MINNHETSPDRKAATAAQNIGKAAFIPQDDRLFDRFSIIVLLLAGVLFMVGLGIDLATPKYPEISNVIDACAQPASGNCEAAVRTFDRQSHVASSLNFWSISAETLQALGLTIVAAVFISSTVDRRTRSYFFNELARKTEVLGLNVLLGMFESRHHPRLFNLVKEHVFEKNVIRRNIDLNYTLSDLAVDLSTTRLAGERYLAVDVIISTVTENINVAQTAAKGAIDVPIKLALPNPMLEELKPYVRINGFRIGGESIDEVRLGEINAELQAGLSDDRLVDAPVEIGIVRLNPGEQVTVSGSYTMIKELQDTEVFRTAEIAENIHLTVTSKSRHDLVIRARSLAYGKLYGQPSPSAQQWKLDDLSLPMQGIMVWWKRSAKTLSSLQSDDGSVKIAVIADPVGPAGREQTGT